MVGKKVTKKQIARLKSPDVVFQFDFIIFHLFFNGDNWLIVNDAAKLQNPFSNYMIDYLTRQHPPVIILLPGITIDCHFFT